MDAAKQAESKAALGLPDDRIHTAVVDVTDDKAVDRAAAEVERAFGRIDVLVASAGITGPNTTTWEYPVDAWRRVIDIDLTAVFLSCRAVVPSLRADRKSHRLNHSH